MAPSSALSTNARVTDAPLPSHWDDVAARWNAAHPQSLWRTYRDGLHTAWLRRWAPAERVERALKTDLFDEAYGEGLFPFLAGRARQVVGIDVSAAILNAAKTRHPQLHGMHADVRRLPFPDAHFDLVVSNSTLDHFASLGDIRTSLREIRRVLRSDGLLLLTLDNAANPFVALRNALPFTWLNRLGVLPYYVGTTCGPRRLRAMLRRAGFHVMEESTLLHCPRVLAVEASRFLERHASARVQKRFLHLLKRCERLARWPTRFQTGYFITVRATPSETA